MSFLTTGDSKTYAPTVEDFAEEMDTGSSVTTTQPPSLSTGDAETYEPTIGITEAETDEESTVPTIGSHSSYTNAPSPSPSVSSTQNAPVLLALPLSTAVPTVDLSESNFAPQFHPSLQFQETADPTRFPIMAPTILSNTPTGGLNKNDFAPQFHQENQ